MPPSGSRRPPPPPPGASVPSGLPSSMKDSGQPPPLPRRPTQGKSKDEPEETSDDEYLQPVVQAQDLYEPMTAPNPVNTSVQRKQGLALPPPNDIISTLEKALKQRKERQNETEIEKKIKPSSSSPQTIEKSNLAKSFLQSIGQSNTSTERERKISDPVKPKYGAPILPALDKPRRTTVEDTAPIMPVADDIYEEPTGPPASLPSGPPPRIPQMNPSIQPPVDDDTDDDWDEDWDEVQEPKKDDDYVIPDGVKEYHNPDEAPPPLPGRPPVKRDIPPPLVNVKPVSEGLPSPKEHKAILPPKTPKPEPPKKPSNSNVKKPDGPQLPPRVVQPPPSENKRDSRSDDNSSAGSTSSGSVSMQQDTAHSNGGSDLRNQSKVRVLPTIPLKHGINKQQEIKNPVTLPSEEIYDDAVSEDLGCYPWFHPNINRQEGDRRVTQLNKNGSYLVRTSSKENHPYTLVVYFDGTTINLPLRKRDDNRFAIGQFKKDEVHFASVPQLITHHTTNNIKLTRGGSVMLTNTPPKR
uniref:SH2 domain-containing protein n=1 Tax=Biomphalaria glabrata TaxID=6526 RepID=A0A2C9L939_BIOGL